jgi:hypothetical protein
MFIDGACMNKDFYEQRNETRYENYMELWNVGGGWWENGG